MEIPSLSIAMSQVNTNSQIGVAVLSKSLDQAQESGASMIKMMDNSMELSVNPAVGSNFDQRV